MEWGVNELPCLGFVLDALLGRLAADPLVGALKFEAKDPKAVNFNPSTF